MKIMEMLEEILAKNEELKKLSGHEDEQKCSMCNGEGFVDNGAEAEDRDMIRCPECKDLPEFDNQEI